MEILIADDHPLFRDALKRAVARILPEARLYETESVEGLQALAGDHPHADLVLLDLNMPGAHGFNALIHLRGQHPLLPVAVVSAREEPAIMRRAITYGASGFIPKSADMDTLALALTRILDGDVWLPASIAPISRPDQEEQSLMAKIADLTPQQFRVLGMLGTGLLNKQIAYEMGISEATIKAHMTAILRKLGASNRTQAVLMVGRLSLDEPGDIATS